MTDYLTRLAARALGQATVLKPRVASRFDPPTPGPAPIVEEVAERDAEPAPAVRRAVAAPPPAAPTTAESDPPFSPATAQDDRAGTTPHASPVPVEGRGHPTVEDVGRGPEELAVQRPFAAAAEAPAQRRPQAEEPPDPSVRTVAAEAPLVTPASDALRRDRSRQASAESAALIAAAEPGERTGPNETSTPMPSPVRQGNVVPGPVAEQPPPDGSAAEQPTPGRFATGSFRPMAVGDPPAWDPDIQPFPPPSPGEMPSPPRAGPPVAGPTVEVHIGRVEVRAELAPPPLRNAQPRAGPRLSLEDFLRRSDDHKSP